MKLDYTVKKFEKKPSLKNKTKLSMQSTVTSALLSKLPSAPAQAVSPTSTNNGWQRSS